MTTSSKTYLVTGAAGWLGRRIVRALTEGDPSMGPVGTGGKDVRVLVMPGESVSEFTGRAQAMRGDLRDPLAVKEFVSGTNNGVLLHLAGIIHPKLRINDFQAINVEGTQNLILAAAEAGIPRAVVMSSNSPIGASHNRFEVFDEDSPYRPYMAYGRSKQAMEEWVRGRFHSHVWPELTIVRAPWFYGPGQPVRQTRFFSMVKAGRFPLFGGGKNRRSMAYVDSLAYGILLAAATPTAVNRIYWLADERPYSMREIVSTVRDVLRDDFGANVKPNTIHLPGIISDCARLTDWALQRVGLYHQEIHVLSEMNLTIACSINRAKRELGYQPLVELREGIRRSVAWCLERGDII